MRTWIKHKRMRDVCLEVASPIRFGEGDSATFKARYWNLGQAGTAFPISAEAHLERIYGGLGDYTIVTHIEDGLRYVFEEREALQAEDDYADV